MSNSPDASKSSTSGFLNHGATTTSLDVTKPKALPIVLRISLHSYCDPLFCRNFAHKTMMPERVAEIVANSTIMIFQQTRIHSEASVIITSCSDKRSKKICSREGAREPEIQRELEIHMHRELGCIADPDNGL